MRLAVVLTFPEWCPLINAKKLPENTARVMIKDWPEEEYAKLPTMPGFWVEVGGTFKFEHGGEERVGEFMQTVQTLELEQYPGDTFAELLAQAGGTVESLGLPELEGYGMRVAKAKKKERAMMALGALAAATTAVAVYKRISK